MIRTFTNIAISMAMIASLSIAHAESLRVSPEWLKAHLQDKNLVILDARPVTDYEVDHINGAFSFPDTLTYQQKSQGGRIVEPDIMQALLRERGINNSKQVLVYDAGQLIDATRLFWALEVYGLNVKVLSSGYDYWLMNGFPTTRAVPEAGTSDYVVNINHKRIASKFSTQLATANPQQIVVDARGQDSYRGEISTAKRFGHIPSAINIPVTHNIIKAKGVNALLNTDEMKIIYSELPKDKKIILYCEIGRASSTNYFALRELDYDVANYDASWQEWGNDFNLPIEK